jgi:DNA-binding NarL/FixJ family response regulator
MITPMAFIVREVNKRPLTVPFSPPLLTEEEEEVVALRAKGWTHAQIGEHLGYETQLIPRKGKSIYHSVGCAAVQRIIQSINKKTNLLEKSK